MIRRTMVQALGLPVLLGAAFSLSGCQGAGAFAQVNERLSQIADSQTQILSRLDALEAKIEEGIKAAPAAPQGKQQPQQPRPNQPDPTATYKVPVGDAHTKGSDEALVTIVEWSDFQCPYCSRVTPTIKQIAEQYGDEVRVAFKHNPLGFHPRAKPAALAAEAAGKQGKFWEMHDKLFENQRELKKDKLVEYAQAIGLDMKAFEADLESDAIKAMVEADKALAAKVGARGTPNFMINGKQVSGARPFDSFKEVIDAELKAVEGLKDV